MKRTMNWGMLATLAALLALPAQLSAANDGNRKESDGKQSQSESQSRSARKLKVFELEHRTPQEMQQLISLRSQHGSHAALPGQIGVGQHTANYRSGGEQDISVAIDQEKDLLFVRGTKEQIRRVEDLVNDLDVSEDKLEKTTFGKLTLIPVQDGDAQKVNTVLSQLQLNNHQMLQMGSVSLIAIRAGDGDREKEKVEQAEEIISKLDAKKKDKSGKKSAEDDSDNGEDT